MCKAMEDWSLEERQEGRVEGMQNGIEEEQNRYSRLILYLSREGKMDMILKAAADKVLLQELYRSYGL